MGYDRYDERSRWRGNDDSNRDWRDPRGDRGFFDRAGDEISSWFGDEDAERRRQQDHARDGRDPDIRRERGWSDNRGNFGRSAMNDRSFEDRFRERGRDYRPFGDDDGRNYEGGRVRNSNELNRPGYFEGSRGAWNNDDGRRGTFGQPTSRDRDHDPHYRSWRDRQMSDLDRDYDDYRRENQSKFESDFGNWRDRRQQKRGLLGQIREHMEVVGNDEEHVGTVDKIAGDRIVLTKSDPESGGAHHSLSCSDVDRVEGDRVFLDCSGDQARKNWRDESRSRALFERDDQGEGGPRILDRSFEGTYR